MGGCACSLARKDSEEAPSRSGDDGLNETEVLRRVVGSLQFKEFSKFAALWCHRATARRLLIATEGNVDLAVKKFLHGLAWRNKKQSLLEGAVPLASDIRCVGHDAQGCAIVYTCCANQMMTFPSCINLAVAELERTTFLSELIGHSGQVIYVYDVFGFSIWKNLAITPLLELAPLIDSYFAERLHKCIVVDMPMVAQFIWDAVSPLLPAKTRKKFIFVRRLRCLELLAERCNSTDVGVLKRVKDSMFLNRTKESALEDRRATWDSTTWFCDALVSEAVTPELLFGDMRWSQEQILQVIEKMETARVVRLGALKRPTNRKTTGGRFSFRRVHTWIFDGSYSYILLFAMVTFCLSITFLSLNPS